MLNYHIVSIGKQTDQNIATLENHYLKQTRPSPNLIELKSHEENLELEGKEILKKIESTFSNSSRIILMTEHGQEYNNIELAKKIEKLQESTFKNIVFIIGGASGFSNEVKEKADETFSLSKLTFPHKLARLLLIEQIYRSQMIIKNHPYHK